MATFLAPEAFHRRNIDEAADIYSLGALITFILGSDLRADSRTLAVLSAARDPLPERRRERFPSVASFKQELSAAARRDHLPWPDQDAIPGIMRRLIRFGKAKLAKDEYKIARDAENVSTLHQACFHGNIEALRQLIAAGADINAADRDGRTPIYYARDVETVSLLIGHGADVNAADEDGWAVLHSACGRFWSVGMIRLLIENGADVNATDINGMTPLHAAYRQRYDRKRRNKIRVLLMHGADPEALDNHGMRPMDYEDEDD